jgi:hypothetical protein
MALSPEEQARIATEIGDLDRMIAQQHESIRHARGPADRTSREEVLRQFYEQSNMLRAQIGLPLVIPGSHEPAPVPAKSGSSVFGCVFWICIAVAVVVWLVFQVSAPSRSYTTPADSERGRTVSYYVTGTASSASLTYQNAQGGTEQRTVTLPWHIDFLATPDMFLYLSAQNQDDSGTIECAILSGSATIQRASSSGGYTIASCSGHTP